MTAIEHVGDAQWSAPSAAGEASARFIRHCLNRGTGIGRETLRAAAPFIVLLHRRSAILASTVVPLERRTAESPLAGELMAELTAAAVEAEDIALAQLVNWARQAWSARRYDVFDAERALPAHLTHQLSELLRAAPSPVMLQAAGTRLLHELAEELRACADEHAKMDRHLGPELFTRPVGALLDGLPVGAPIAPEFLDDGPDALVHQALAALGGAAAHYDGPAGAAKLRRLTAAVDEVTGQVRRVLELAAEFRWRPVDVPDPHQPEYADLDPDLVPVLLAALESDPAPESPRTPDGRTQLAWFAAEALASADPHHRHQVAVVARLTDIDPKLLEPALAPLERLRERGEELLRDVGDKGAQILGPLGEMVTDALARGDLDEAGQGVELLAEARAEFDVRQGLERMREGLAALAVPDAAVALDVRTAETYVVNGDVDAAAEYLRRAEERFRVMRADADQGVEADQGIDADRVGVADRVADATGQPQATDPEPLGIGAAPPASPEADRVPMTLSPLADGLSFPAQRGSAVATIQEGWSPDASPGTRAAARTLLHQLGTEGSFHEVSQVARQLTFGAPEAAADLLEAAVPRFPRQTHPLMWQLQEQALRAAGRHTSADEVFHKGHPPLPPAELLSAGPVAPLPPLAPWLTSPVGAALGDPAVAEAVRLAALNESAAAAEAFTAAARGGAKIALGPAVGWLVAAGNPAAALALYRDLAARQYLTAAVDWNVACAYAAVGADRLAVDSLRVMASVLPGRPNREQKDAADAYCGRLGFPSPFAETETRPEPPVQVVEEQTRESLAKQMYESGDVERAARELEDLLRANPSSPGAFLMLRICRETGDLPRAQAVVERISEARGALSWRHHIELARTALDSRIADYEVARHELERARELKASETWIAPLEQRLREVTTAAHVPGAVQRDSLPGAGETGPMPWTADRSAVQAPRGGAYSGMGTAAVVAGLRSGTLPAPSEETLSDLHDAVAVCHDDYLVRDFAFWLMDTGRPQEAVRLLERSLVWTAPQRIPRALLVRDRAAAAAGLPASALRPPSAPRLAEAGPAAPERAHHIGVHRTPIVGPPATQPVIRAAQQPLPGASRDEVADAWARAARAHPVATGNALAALVEAGRAEEALRLHNELADTRWLGSGTAWNLGCAYAATGRLEASAATFEYHARVSTRRYDVQQLDWLGRLFAVVGRPVPAPARSGPEPTFTPTASAVVVEGRGPAQSSASWQNSRTAYPRTPASAAAPARSSYALEEAESNAAELIAKCRSEPTSHHFRLAADAARRAMRAGGTATAGRYVATMRELFTYQPDPQPDTVAAMAMVLETAERYENAWDLLTEWIERTRGKVAELLASAVRVAPILGRVEQLYELLQPHVTPDSGFELHLSLAKLAQTLHRKDDVVHHAEQALRLNPNCAEAANLLQRYGGGRLPRHDHQQAVGLRQRLAEAPRRQAVEMLEGEYGDALAALRVQALSYFRPEISRNTLKKLLTGPLREPAADLLAAAEDDWELASNRARRLLDEAPRAIGLIKATAYCLIEAARHDEVRTVAGLPASEADSRDILVRLACAQGDHAEAGRLMSGVEVWHNDRMQLLAHVGVLAQPDMGDSPAEAARLLLVHARLKSRSENLAGLAALLAHRAGRNELVDEAIELLRRDELPTTQALVDSALAAHVPEALHGIGRPLGGDQLRAIVAYLGPDRERAVRFLSPTNRRTSRVYGEEQQVSNRILGGIYAEDGMVERALEAYRKALELGDDREAIRRELTERCAEWGAADPSEAALALLAGDAVTDIWADTEVPPGAAALVARLAERPGRPGPELGAQVEQVARAFAEGAVGPDAVLCRRLGERWRRLVEMIADVNARGETPLPPINAERPDVDVTFREATARAYALSSASLRDAALQVHGVLKQVWETSGHERLRAEAGTQAPLSWREKKATRLEGGPVELRLKLRAGSEPLGQVTVRVRGTDIVHELGRMEPEAVSSVFLVIPWTGSQLVIDADGILPDDSVGQAKKFVATIEPLIRRDGLSARFRPGDPVNTTMFAGRAAEMERLRAAFVDAPSESVPPVCMTGSRRAGKTSLVRQLTRLWGGTPESLLPPERWRIPHVFPVLLDGQAVDPRSAPLLTWIAKEVRDQLEEHYDPDPAVLTLPEAPHAVDFRRWWRGVRRAVWPDRKVGLLLAVDESQDLLRRYEDAEDLSRALGDLRRLRQDGTLALLVTSSGTAAQLGGRLAGTLSRQDFLRPLSLGPLDRQATLQVLHQGFSGTGVDVRPTAAELVFRYTSGHPQHVHMMGRALCELLEAKRRTVVDDDLVDAAFGEVAGQDEAVLGLLDAYDPAEDTLDVLLRVAQELLTDPDEEAVRAALAEETHRSKLDDYLEYGLLLRNGNELTWINSVVETWLRGQTPSWDDGTTASFEHEKDLRPHYVVTYRFEDSRTNTCEVQPLPGRDVTYIAKRYPEAPQTTLQRIAELFDGQSGMTVEGLPDGWKRNGSWLLYRKVPGRPLAASLRHGPAMKPFEAARMVMYACYAVGQVWEERKTTHGDIRPGNLIVPEDTGGPPLYVVGWGHGGGLGGGKALEQLLPSASSGYYPWAAREGRVPTTEDDTYALAGVLYSMLSGKEELPWEGPASADGPRHDLLRFDHLPEALRLILIVAFGDPARRFRSPADLAAAINAVLPHEPSDRREPQGIVLNLSANSASSTQTTSNSEAKVDMGDKFEVSGTFTNSAVGNNITNTGNTNAQGAPAGPEASLADLVTRLQAELDGLRSQLGAGDAQDLDVHVSSLATEAASEQPDPRRVGRLAGWVGGILRGIGGAASAIAVTEAISGQFGA
ncbi:hypothetical protein [Streptomyces sp. NPDC058084]|uniref:hypothetical protein n=1 Tax=Streptomyces sp. NPDC058084 TaxID=3346333 RepID=UPI0036E34819